MGLLKDYCKKRNIKLEDLAKITGVAISTLYIIDKDDQHPVKNTTMKTIMHTTNNKYGEPLMPWEYLTGWITPNKEL